jgi:O-antigen/teichoic acid export membrane protein
MIGLLHYRLDAILLSLLAPAKDVGIYMVAYRFVDQAFLLPGVFIAAIFPTLTRYVHTDDARRDPLVSRVVQVLSLGAVAVAVAVFTLAAPLVSVIAGEEFSAAVQPARILAASLVFIFVSPIFYNLLIAMDRQRDLMAIGVGALLINLTLNLVLIPRYSYNGAAVATILSEGLAFAGTFGRARWIAGVTLDGSFIWRVLGAAAVAIGVIAITIGTSPWLSFVLAEIAFVATALGLRAVAPGDFKAIMRRSDP